MKYCLWIALIIIGCSSKDEIKINSNSRISSDDFFHELKHKKVKELFILVFNENFSPLEWKDIFDQTKKLSQNKKQLRLIEGLDDEKSSLIRGKAITENAKILSFLSEKSLFLMNWTAGDENCKIVFKYNWQLVCKPRNRDNPLNGGLPDSVDPLVWVQPNPVQSTVKTPYLRIELVKNIGSESLLSYALELRLKKERIDDSESWFKGDAIPAVGSMFQRSDGSVTQNFFKYGYAELTLGN